VISFNCFKDQGYIIRQRSRREEVNWLILASVSGPTPRTVRDPAAICVFPASAIRQQLMPADRSDRSSRSKSSCVVESAIFFWPCRRQATSRRRPAADFSAFSTQPQAACAPCATIFPLPIFSDELTTRTIFISGSAGPVAEVDVRLSPDDDDDDPVSAMAMPDARPARKYRAE